MIMYDLSAKNGAAPLDPTRVSTSVAMALNWGGQQAPANQRWDSAGGPVAPARSRVLDAYARHCDSQLIAAMGGRLGSGVREYFAAAAQTRVRNLQARADAEGRRFDAQSFIAGGVGGFPRDFDFIRTKIWEEEVQPLSAYSAFPMDTSVPLGARTHTARRELGAGTAAIYRGGSEIPRATIGFVEEQFGVIFIVCAVGQNMFETLTLDFANIQAYEKGLRRAKRLVDERANDVAMFGDASSKVYGILKYPSLPKKVLPLAFSDAGTPDYPAQVRQLQDLGNEPAILSGTRFKPNRLAISPALNGYLSTRQHSSNATDTTMLEYYVRTNTLGITEALEMPELSGIGPNGEDGILFWRDDADTVQNVVLQPTTTLPVFQSGPLDQLTVVYTAVGGMVCGNVGNCVLGYATVDAGG